MAQDRISRVRRLRHRIYARLRHAKHTLGFLTQQGSRLTASRTSKNGTPNVFGTNTLVFAGQPSNTNTFIVGSKTYTFKTALTEAKATGTATTDNTNAADASTLTLGSVVYTFQNTLTAGSANAVHVKIGGSADATLLNLARAINNSGGTPGTDYDTTGTAAHSIVASATSVTSHAILITAKLIGTQGNIASTSTTSPNSHITFGGALLTGGLDAVLNEVLIDDTAAHTRDNLVVAITAGAGAGTKYATGTVASAEVTAAAASADMLVTSLVAGATGNTNISETSSNLSVTGTTLTGGGTTWTFSSHGFTDLSGPYAMTNSGGGLPTGYTTSQLLWISRVDANTLRFGISLEALRAANYLQATTNGTGTHTIKKSVTAAGMFGELYRNTSDTLAAATDVDNLA